MIKFHRPNFLIAQPGTPSAQRTLLQKIFHKKKDDLSPAERLAIQRDADRSGRKKLLGGLISIKRKKLVSIEHKELDLQSLTKSTVEHLRALADRMRELDAKQKETDQVNEAKRFADMRSIKSDDDEAETRSLDAKANAALLFSQLQALEESEEEIQEVGSSDIERSVVDTQQSSEKKKSRFKRVSPVEALFKTALGYTMENVEDTPEIYRSTSRREDSIKRAIKTEEENNGIYGDGWRNTLDEQNRERSQVANEIVNIFSAAARNGIALSKALSNDEITYLTRAMGMAIAPKSLHVEHDGQAVRVKVDGQKKTIRMATYTGSFDPLKNIARQTAGLLHSSQVDRLLERMNGSAGTLDEATRDLATQPRISAATVLENVEKVLATLTHIDTAELSRLCNQPGEQGDLAESQIFDSLNNLEASIRGLHHGMRKAFDSLEGGSLPATAKQAVLLLEHIQARVEVLQNEIALTKDEPQVSLSGTDSDDLFEISSAVPHFSAPSAMPPTPPDSPDRQLPSTSTSGPQHHRNFSHLPQLRNHPSSNLRISTSDGTSAQIMLAEHLNIPLSPWTPDSGNDVIHSSEMEAARLSRTRGLGWPLQMLIRRDRNFITEQIATTSRKDKGKEILIVPEETGNEASLPAPPSAQASSSRLPLHQEYNIAPPPVIPARLKNGFAASAEPLTPTDARSLNTQELSVFKNWSGRVSKSLSRSSYRKFESEMKKLVKAMEQDGQLRDGCINLMEDGLRNCTDRALVMWQQIWTKKYIRDAELGKYTIDDVYDMGIRMYRLAQVDEHALQLIKNIRNNKRLKKYGEKESVEVILHARESLRDLLNLPIPQTNSTWSIDAARIPGMFSGQLIAYGKTMLRAELEDGKNGSHQVAHFLASWTPLTQQLRRLSPELDAIHQEIDTHRDSISSAIEEHNDGDPKWSKLDPLNSTSYEDRLKQCGNEAEVMHFAADLAAVKTFMYGHHETYPTQKPPLEVELEKVNAIRTPTVAQRFIPALKEALASRQINPSWVHPINRWNLLHVAAASCDPELVKALKELGVDMHQADNKGMLPLHVAASIGSAAAIQALDDLQNISARDKTGNSPVHWVAFSGSVDALGALLQKTNAQGSQEAFDESSSNGVDVNIKNPISGQTPLHIAVAMEKFVMARTLIGIGADPRIKDQNNKTAKDLLKHASAKNDPQGYKLTKKALEMGKKIMLLQE